MLKRSWLQALAVMVCAAALTACGGDECTTASDCKKTPPSGQEYQCVNNACELRTKPNPTPTCSPTCASGEICDGSSGTGVCKTCTATEGCAAPLFCDTAANSGKGVCRACADTSSSGTDQGCSAAAPVCDAAGNNGAGVCKACADTASGGAMDSGCSVSIPMCDPAANNGAGQCKACVDSAEGNAQDQGCSASAPVCDPTSANGVGACKACVDSAAGTGTDTGCTDAAPMCNTSANGGKGVCRACLDTAAGTGTDTGCADTAPICDAAASGGAGACKACVDSAAGTGTDTGCGDSTPLCDAAGNSGAGVCKACLDNATGTDQDLGCTSAAKLCDPAASNGAGACRACLNTSNSSADLGCSAPTDICDTAASSGVGACKVCLSTNEGCAGNQTCNTEGTACEGCADSSECTNPSTPVCKPPPPVSICVECTANADCAAARPVCDTATNFCGCTSDAQCAAAPGNTDYCDTMVNNTRGQCTVCLTDAHCSAADATHPFCDNRTACIQCRTNADCALNQVCNAATKSCDTVPDVNPTETSAQIQAFIDAPIGTLNPTITIPNAYVTYIKPALGTDVAGFFVQAQPDGPAMFVAVDAATYSLQVGDRITFTVGEVQRLGGDLEAAATITNLTINARGYPVQNLDTDTPAGLAVDRSSASDLQTNLIAGYESELIRLSGTIASGTNSSGSGHVAFNITTAGMTTANGNFRLRVPITLSDNFNIVQGCTFTLKAGPMWRFTSGTTNNAQPSAYYASDLIFPSCPRPNLLSAIDASLTTVVLTFDRNIDPATVTDAATQFTFTNDLTATAAQVNGKVVTLTTSQQTPGTSYTVTVAASVKDTVGGAVATNSANFKGFRPRAVLLLNEVNPNVSSANGNRDLIELKVLTAGTTDGLTLLQEPANGTTQSLLATMPDANVAVGDFIVIHMSPDAAKGDATASETQSTGENTASTNYATAWDFVGNPTHIVYSNQVLRVKAPTGATQDAVPFVRSDLTGTSRPSAFPDRLTAIQTEGLWIPADCGGSPCIYDPPTGVPSAVTVSVDWKSAGSSSTGNSIQRMGATDTNQASDWAAAVAPPTWGAPNP